MSTKTAEGTDTTDLPPITLAPKQPSKLVLIVGLIAVLITAQAIITYLLIPKSAPPSGGGNSPADGSSLPPEDEQAVISTNDTAEVSIGDFNCTNSSAAPGIVIHVDFKLYAVTASRQSSSLEEQLKSHQARVRQVVNKVVRSSSLENLNDPNLGTIKRLVREEINRLLNKSLITEVVISDIRTMEQ